MGLTRLVISQPQIPVTEKLRLDKMLVLYTCPGALMWYQQNLSVSASIQLLPRKVPKLLQSE